MGTLALTFTAIDTGEAEAQRSRSASWFTNASVHRRSIGRKITYRCPPKRTRSKKAVYGSNPYTLDSGVCRAGVHSGRITRAGGFVTIRVIGGKIRYIPSFRYGIATKRWGRYHTSFRVIGGSPLGRGAVPARPTTIARPPVARRGVRISWHKNLARYRGQVGRKFTFYCPPAPRRLSKSIWGSGFYTLDSGICKAAVHAGRITRAGGTVRVKLMAGRAAYYPSTRYGIRTGKWGRYHTSFIVY